MDNEKQDNPSQKKQAGEQKVGIKPIGIPGGQTGGQMNAPTGAEMPQHADNPRPEKEK